MKILVPFDFSQEAIYAVQFGEQIANETSATLKVIHCLNLPDYPYHRSESAKSLLKILALDAESSVINQLKQILTSPPDVEIREGSASSVILKENLENDIRYTMMGYKEQNVPEKIGSTTRNILRFAQGSVFSIKRKLELRSIADILIVTDFQQTPVSSVANVKLIQELTGARVKVLYVNSRDNWLTSAETYNRMDDFCKVHNLQNAALDIINDRTLEAGVLHAISRSKVDLIALKIHQGNNTLNSRETHLSAEKIIDNTDTPVMTFAHTSIYGIN